MSTRKCHLLLLFALLLAGCASSPVRQDTLVLVNAHVHFAFDEHHCLLLRHRTDDNTWDFPGGYMEPGESTEETARREVREETGLEIGEKRLR